MPPWEDFRLTVEVLLQIIGTIAIFAGAVSGIVTLAVKAKGPLKKLQKEVDRHGELLAKDYERLNSAEESSKLVLKAMMTLIDHELTGNSVDRLKTVKAEIQTYLIDK